VFACYSIVSVISGVGKGDDDNEHSDKESGKIVPWREAQRERGGKEHKHGNGKKVAVFSFKKLAPSHGVMTASKPGAACRKKAKKGKGGSIRKKKPSVPSKRIGQQERRGEKRKKKKKGRDCSFRNDSDFDMGHVKASRWGGEESGDIRYALVS